MEPFPRERQTPQALAAMQKADAEKWCRLIKEFGIKGAGGLIHSNLAP
jgi:hypothetical protein